MKILKQIVINSATAIVTIAVIGTAYAALSAVNPGDTLSSSSWNEVVSKLSNTDTNSTDLVTKSYVDSVVSASGGGGGFSNCESKYTGLTTANSVTLTCSAGKSIRSHSSSCAAGTKQGGSGQNQDNAPCGVMSLTTTSLTGRGYLSSYYNGNFGSQFSASIICCDD